MRIAIIGAGQIGAAHAARLNALNTVDELLIADAGHSRAADLASRLDKAQAISFERAFEAADGVVITANTSVHAELIHRALDAKRPAFCEKPVALDVANTLKVVEHAEHNPDVPVQIGFQRRFDAGYIKAREVYRSGKLGFVHTLHATTYDEAPPPAAYIPTSGGLFKDCSIHDFDIIAWVTGERAVKVYGVGSNLGEKFFTEAGDVDTSHALVTYESGLTASVSATRYNGAGHDVRLEVFGSNGGLFVGLDDRSPLVSAEQNLSWQQAEPYHTYHERFNAAYIAELAHFVQVVAGQAPSACTPRDALDALLIAEACGESLRSGNAVTIARG